MIAYLESGVLTPPRTIAAAPAKVAPGSGLVTTNIEHGELLLHPRGRRDERLRLRWEPEGARERELPAGTYVVSGYRHIAKAKDGAPWIWSTGSPAYARLEVKAGESVRFTVREKIRLQTRAFTKKGKHRVGLAFQAEPKLGHTLYRGGKRIALRWQCLDAQGEVLTEGVLRYG